MKRGLLSGLIILSFFMAAPQAAQADALDTFIDLYGDIERLVPPNTLPVTAAELRNSRQFIVCLINKGLSLDAVSECINDNPGADELPDEVRRVVRAYISWRAGDYWEAAYALGRQAACIIVEMLAGGLPVCEFIELLVDAAKALWDVAKAVWEFLGDVAETVYCVFVGFLGGCKDETPPLQLALEKVFYPHRAEALNWIKDVSEATFRTHVQNLRNHASNRGYEPAVVKNASDIFEMAVDADWTADMLNNEIDHLAGKRFTYQDTRISDLARRALTEYLRHGYQGDDMGFKVQQICNKDFSQELRFAHVDRWIDSHRDENRRARIMKNWDWCQKVLWIGNRQAFNQEFLRYIKDNLCPTRANQLPKCETIHNYKLCMGIVGKDLCDINIAAIGKEVADKIKRKFEEGNSRIPCEYTFGSIRAPNPDEPATINCTRPTQRLYCKEFSEEFHKDVPLPAQVVNCVGQNTPDYETLRSAVESAVEELKQKPFQDGGTPSFIIGTWDPLTVQMEDYLGKKLAELEGENPSFGFQSPSTKPGFEYVRFSARPGGASGSNLVADRSGIDGVSTPLLWSATTSPSTPDPLSRSRAEQKLRDRIKGDPAPIIQSKLMEEKITPQIKTQVGKSAQPKGVMPPSTGPRDKTAPPMGTKGAKQEQTAPPTTLPQVGKGMAAKPPQAVALDDYTPNLHGIQGRIAKIDKNLVTLTTKGKKAVVLKVKANEPLQAFKVGDNVKVDNGKLVKTTPAS